MTHGFSPAWQSVQTPPANARWTSVEPAARPSLRCGVLNSALRFGSLVGLSALLVVLATGARSRRRSVLRAGGDALAFAASCDWYFQPSAWVIAPAAGILIGAVLGLELGVAVAPEPAVEDQPARAALQLAPTVVMGQGAVVLGVDGRF